MTILSFILIAKILVTIGAIILPFLFAKPEFLDKRAGFGQPNLPFYRLYGMAILALVVAYSGGLIETLQGIYPTVIVAMGLTSNLGAALIMIATGYVRNQRLLTAFFATIGLGFACSTLSPDLAMLVIW